jgi:hypothetical protein
MITREQLLQLMPPSDGKITTNYSTIVNRNIIKTIHKESKKAAEITKNIAPLFKGNSIEDTCNNIWKFLKTQIKYEKDEYNQDIRLPNAFIQAGKGDCKSYSLFAHSILQNLDIPSAYRYTSYSADPTPQHVYVVALTGNNKVNGSEVVVTDGVWNTFNKQKPFTFKKDFMEIRTLSGTDEIGKLQLGKKIKQAAAKIQDKAKDTAVVKAAAKIQDKAKDTAVVKAAAKIQDKAKDTAVVKAAAKAQNVVKQDAKKVVKLIEKGAAELKNIPQGAKVVLGAPARRAFRTLVALNFHSYANKLNADRDKTFAMWKKLGGISGELDNSIQAGLKRKAILGIGCVNCKIKNPYEQIGDPTTIAAALAAATPVIIAFSEILKEAFSAIKAGKDAFKKEEQLIQPAEEKTQQNNPQPLDYGPVTPQYMNNDGTTSPGVIINPNSPGTPNYYGGEINPVTPTPENSDTEEKSSAAPLLLGALAVKLLFF